MNERTFVLLSCRVLVLHDAQPMRVKTVPPALVRELRTTLVYERSFVSARKVHLCLSRSESPRLTHIRRCGCLAAKRPCRAVRRPVADRHVRPGVDSGQPRTAEASMCRIRPRSVLDRLRHRRFHQLCSGSGSSSGARPAATGRSVQAALRSDPRSIRGERQPRNGGGPHSRVRRCMGRRPNSLPKNSPPSTNSHSPTS